MPDQSSASTEHAIIQEISGPLESLPDDPLAMVNAEFPTALRGYDRVAVDEYVRQTRRLVAELQATRSPEAAVRRALERVGEQISGILQRAHETAEQITAQSRVEAEDRLEQARAEARQLAGAAEQRVRDLDVDTDRIWLERQRIVADAEDLAAQLQALARTAAERFPADPEAGTAEAEGGGAAHGGAVADGGATASDAAEDVDAGEETMPFDAEDEDPTRAVTPIGEDEAEDEWLDEEKHSVQDPPDSEIEETVAFEPLTPGERESTPPAPAAGPQKQGGEENPTKVTPPSEDSTAVIPPASQAANRRQSK
jgi:cell division septum initiation protein DivIVA